MRLKRAVPVLAVSVVLLSGCGVEATQFHPGVAAQVGDQTLTTKHVDAVTGDICSFALSQSSDSSSLTQLPLRYLSHEVANALVLKAATEQLAAEYDVSPGTSYEAAVGALRAQVPDDVSTAERDALVEFQAAGDYYQDVLVALGAKELGQTPASGTDDGSTDASTSQQDQFDAGAKVLTAWAEKNDVEVNPKYGVEIGQGAQVDTDTSVAVSTLAKQGLADQPDDNYSATLPRNQVCGG